MIRLVRLSAGLFVLLAGANLWSQSATPNCTLGGTTIFFGNGVDVSSDYALGSMLDLQNAVNAAISTNNSYDHSCFRYKLAYDSTFIDPSTSCGAFFPANPAAYAVNCGNLVNLLVEAGIISGIQVAAQPGFPSQLSMYLSNLSLAPFWVLSALSTVITKLSFLLPSDLQTQVTQDYNPEIVAGNVVIVVAHSQGNLYANEAYQYISPAPSSTSPPDFSIVSVATPANTIAGYEATCPSPFCPYVTLENDIITAVPESLRANAYNGQPGDPCLSATGSINPVKIITAKVECHSFDTSYMVGPSTHDMIVNDVVNDIPVPIGVTTAGTGSGTVTSNPSGIDCGSTCIAAFPLLTSEGNGNTITLTATADSGSAFNRWSGTCTQLPGNTSSGDEITFPVVNSGIQVFPEDCTATFGPPAPAVVLNPYGNQSLSTTPGPYDIQVVGSDLTPISAPAIITITILRQVFSQCSGLLFVSQITASIPQGQTSVAFGSAGNVAGRDPACMSLPITTTFTVQQATLAPNTVLNLSTVPSQQLSLSITR